MRSCAVHGYDGPHGTLLRQQPRRLSGGLCGPPLITCRIITYSSCTNLGKTNVVCRSYTSVSPARNMGGVRTHPTHVPIQPVREVTAFRNHIAANHNGLRRLSCWRAPYLAASSAIMVKAGNGPIYPNDARVSPRGISSSGKPKSSSNSSSSKGCWMALVR